MTFQEANRYHTKINDSLRSRSLLNAIDYLNDFLVKGDCLSYKNDVQEILETYKFLLSYYGKGTKDSHRLEIYNGLLQKCYYISDVVFVEIAKADNPSLYFNNLRYFKISKSTLDNLLEKLYKNYSEFEIGKLGSIPSDDLKRLRLDIENTESSIFKYLWSSISYDSVYSKIFNDKIPNYFKEQLVSAIFLSCIELYDDKKILDLFDIYNSTESVSIQIKAIVAIILLSYLYDDRFKISNSIGERLKLTKDNVNLARDINSIIIQFVKSKDTERITKKMEDELIPQLMKLSPELYKKIKGSKNLGIDEDLEGNPAWKDIIENTSISKDIQELTELQMEGSDVFMSTFARLKHFPFFQNISNWFLPFHLEGSAMSGSAANLKISETIDSAPFLCNSDKYSFLFATMSVPDSEKHLMLSQFESQSSDLKEMKASDINTGEQMRDKAISVYIQDLYRFFKLFNRKLEFVDPFKIQPFVENSIVIESLEDIRSMQSVVSGFYFKRGYFEDALKLYLDLTKDQVVDSTIYQKIGFCYQNLSKYDEALSFYKKADIIEANNVWTLKHIAFCNKNLGNLEESLKYYQMAEKLQGNNNSLLLNIGHLLLSMGKPNDALKYYYKVDYLSTNSSRSIRPIAWAEFIVDNYAKSKEYYDKISEAELTPQDYLNLGHLYLVQNQIPDAISAYGKSRDLMIKNNEDFKSEFMSDSDILFKKGVEKYNLSFILDSLRMFNEK